jgi:putative oxidoreductase
MSNLAAAPDHGAHHDTHGIADLRVYLVPLGRALFAAIFILGALGHFDSRTVGYAASQQVPAASIAVPLSGILALTGGLMVLLGFRARLGAWLIVLFLVPVTLFMHRFWAVTDPMMASIQQAMFMKNLSMIGAALLLTHFGAGPVAFDTRRER